MLLSPLIHTTSTVIGNFKNLYLQEDDIDFYNITDIVKATRSSYGCNMAPDYVLKRKRSFNSAILIDIKSKYIKNRIYKFKCYRRGKFEVCGVRNIDWSDMLPVCRDLEKYLQKVNSDETIIAYDMFSVMINFRCCILNNRLKILLVETIEKIETYKKDETDRNIIISILENCGKLSSKMRKNIIKYIPVNRFDVGEIIYDIEQKPSLIMVKFYRPSEYKSPKNKYDIKKSTVKIYQSGKLNIDATKSQKQAEHIRSMLNMFFDKYSEYVLCDLDASSDFESSSSDSMI